jgi:hypothetical protein
VSKPKRFKLRPEVQELVTRLRALGPDHPDFDATAALLLTKLSDEEFVEFIRGMADELVKRR